MSASGPSREPRGTPSGEPGDLARLGERIDRLRGDTAGAEPGADAAQGQALGQGWRISLELVVAVAVGGGVGWLIDRWLGTLPWVTITLIVLGFVAGIYSAIKSANRMEADYLRNEARKRGGTSGRQAGDGTS